jgi:hypothetical protein
VQTHLKAGIAETTWWWSKILNYFSSFLCPPESVFASQDSFIIIAAGSAAFPSM